MEMTPSFLPPGFWTRATPTALPETNPAQRKCESSSRSHPGRSPRSAPGGIPEANLLDIFIPRPARSTQIPGEASPNSARQTSRRDAEGSASNAAMSASRVRSRAATAAVGPLPDRTQITFGG